jgi:hypothetical protein
MWHYAAAAQGVMMAKQKPKDKGTRAESDVVAWAKKHGFYKASRLVLHGSGDVGDVHLAEGVMIQVKDGYTERKEPTDYQVGTWLAQVDKQTRAGEWDYGLLVHKRYGKADPDSWRWYMTGEMLIRLVAARAWGDEMTNTPPQYVQLMGYMIPSLLRNAGVTP